MSANASVPDTILIVDDEEPVRKTMRDWLREADLGCKVLMAGDAAVALNIANEQFIDLAILDWNLGAGNDGLQLLEDLVLFNPDIVAILVTGFANQATPLAAMRMGVRDYLDKNQDFSKRALVEAVKKQLDRIRPAKQARRINEGLAAFRSAVEQVLPLVQSAAALNDPVPLPTAVRSLFRFLLTTTGARDGVLFVHAFDPSRDPPESCRAYDPNGQEILAPLVPFAQSLAGAVVSMQEPCALERLGDTGDFTPQPFERGRRNALAAPVDVGPGIHVVLELFDKHDRESRPAAFDDSDKRLVRGASEFAADLLRQALAERQTHRVLSDAVGAALRAGDQVAQSLQAHVSECPPPAVMEQLQTSLASGSAGTIDAASTLRLAEAIRLLSLRYGSHAVEHCTRLVDDLRRLLDEVSGTSEGQP